MCIWWVFYQVLNIALKTPRTKPWGTTALLLEHYNSDITTWNRFLSSHKTNGQYWINFIAPQRPTADEGRLSYVRKMWGSLCYSPVSEVAILRKCFVHYRIPASDLATKGLNIPVVWIITLFPGCNIHSLMVSYWRGKTRSLSVMYSFLNRGIATFR